MLTSSARNRRYLGLHHESVDSKIKFSIEPLPGDDAFDQWKDAMKAVAGLSMGIPVDFRKKVWLALADNYLNGLCIDWEKTKSLAFNRKSNPDDNKLDQQIVKDLHRTGCSGFSGDENDEDRAVLQRVLLAYARWNKQVGYCQGFNVIAALILDVMDRQEDCALKVMIYLIDRVLPESYFANNLRALSVDMAVFRHLLRLQLPRFSRHLDRLQASTLDQKTGTSYEPPLTDVFTMQWFLTLFATCLPKSTALRVWDAVLLEGSQVLLRTAVCIWGRLQERLLEIQTPDEFYTAMGSLSQEMLDGTILDEDALIQSVYEMSSSATAMVGLNELRQAYSKRLDAVAAAGKQWLLGTPSGGHGRNDDVNVDDLAIDVNCFSGMLPFPQQLSPQRSGPFSRSDSSASLSDTLQVQGPSGLVLPPFANIEKIAMDVDSLSKQYAKLQERQKQARIILAGARQNRPSNDVTHASQDKSRTAETKMPSTSVAVNHLYIGREMTSNSRNRSAASTRSPGGTTVQKPNVGRHQHVVNSGRLPPPCSKNVVDNTWTSRPPSCPVSNDEVTTETVLTISDKNVEHVVKNNYCKGESKVANSSVNKGDAENVDNKLAFDITTDNSKLLNSAKTITQSISCRTLPADVASREDVLDVSGRNSPINSPSLGSQLHPIDAHTPTADDSTSSAKCASPFPNAAESESCDSVLRQYTVGLQASNTAESVNVLSRTVVAASSSSSCSVSSPSKQYKAFNPFPKQHSRSSRRRAMNGVRLGLYAAPPADGGRS